ncbi:OsmC family protein [Edaphocola aurantiacus]|uniref:OsmC family protein n=1 Tax=Edaphocola aurantiacus TaxID=2601682 RepID=UPI001C96B168|nr:OsmC family protein [Edaphocola aurantiacus]
MPQTKLTIAAAPYGFATTDDQGIVTRMDIRPELGGNNSGSSPMMLLLNALAGCASIDVLMILNKMKISVEDYVVTVDGEREKDKEPALWQTIHMRFTMKGDPAIEPSVKRAIDLSLDKYCSVAFTLRAGGATITYDLHISAD